MSSIEAAGAGQSAEISGKVYGLRILNASAGSSIAFEGGTPESIVSLWARRAPEIPGYWKRVVITAGAGAELRVEVLRDADERFEGNVSPNAWRDAFGSQQVIPYDAIGNPTRSLDLVASGGLAGMAAATCSYWWNAATAQWGTVYSAAKGIDVSQYVVAYFVWGTGTVAFAGTSPTVAVTMDVVAAVSAPNGTGVDFITNIAAGTADKAGAGTAGIAVIGLDVSASSSGSLVAVSMPPLILKLKVVLGGTGLTLSTSAKWAVYGIRRA